MKWVLPLLSFLAFVASTVVVIYASVYVTAWPYTVPLLALLCGLRYLTGTQAFPPGHLPIGFTILFGTFHFIFAPHIHRWMLSFYTRPLYSIHQACYAYASGHEGKFPDGKSSNEAFRQLFIAGIVDDEKLFGIGGINQVIPDGNRGTQENGFLQALAPGECAYFYVRGLDTDDQRSTAPLLFVPFLHSDGNPYLILVRCGGAAKADLITDKAIRETPNVKFDDRFFEEYLKTYYGIAPLTILKPEGPIRDVFALAREQKMNIRLIEAALLAAIWLPFLLIYWIKTRHKAKALPELPAPQA